MDCWTPRAVALGFALAAGCISPSPALVVEETTRALGHGVFRWHCLDDSDPTCGTGSFPRMVALGSRFELSFTPEASVPDEIEVFSIEAVSPTRLGLETGQWVALRAGDVSVAGHPEARATGSDFTVPEGGLLVFEVDPESAVPRDYEALDELELARHRRRVMLVSTGIGAGVLTAGAVLLGMGLHRRMRLRRPGDATLSVAPAVGPDQLGVSASMRF